VYTIFLISSFFHVVDVCCFLLTSRIVAREGILFFMTQILKIVALLLAAGILAVVALVLIRVAPRIAPVPLAPVIANFEECVAAGNPVMESYPRQCRTQDGRLFVEEIPNEMPDGLGLQTNGCAVAGCSGQLCVSADEAGTIVTTCEYRAEYACYAEASCEPQADGQCGWTSSPELQRCLVNPPLIEPEVQ